MKIAIWHNFPSGGGKRALYNHVKGLANRGHKLEVWCPPTADRSYLPLTKFAVEHLVEYDRTFYKARWRWEKSIEFYRRWKKNFDAMDRHCQLCAEQINAGGFDVLLSGNCFDFAVSPIGRHVQIPSLLYNQEPKRSFYEARPRLPWIAQMADKEHASIFQKIKKYVHDLDYISSIRAEAREEWISAEAFDLMLVNSAFSRESVLRAYGFDSKVCYLGIDSELFSVSIAPRENYVVGLGGIQHHKGVETAIRAIATIVQSKRPKLLWIGNMIDPDYPAEMSKLAEQMGVVFESKQLVTDEDLVNHLGRATMMIYTSRLEPFGFAPLEANSCGTPVVAVAEGGVRETIIHDVNGLLVADRDPQSLGHAISSLLDDPELARRLGENGSRNVRNVWTWEKSVENLERHLLSILR